MGKTTQRAKERAKKGGKGPDQPMAQIPVGQIPSVVLQRVFEYLPAYFEALKAIHEDLEEIKELLKE